MFTGIVEETGTVAEAQPLRLVIQAQTALEGLHLGDSIAVSGPCLTAVAVGHGAFTVDLSEETVKRTTLGSLRTGVKVNLERALATGSRMGGHIVQGHVDAVGKVVEILPLEGSTMMCIEAPPQVMGYIVEKGFIAVDGVSLTVTTHDVTSFTVSMLRYTLRCTSLGHHQVGDLVNLEVDILAKYVERLLTGGAKQW